MKEHGCLFTASNVRAILADEKTQTRRLITDRNSLGNVKPSQCDMARAFADHGFPDKEGVYRNHYLHAPVVRDHRGNTHDEDGRCVADDGVIERIYERWEVGDRLWVRETWGCPEADFPGVPGGRKPTHGDRIFYRAEPAHSYQWDHPNHRDHSIWRSPIHMPRWACRLVLEITHVRIERLQSISEVDAMAEGAQPILVPPDGGSAPHVEGFQELWISINGAASWEDNPFVRAFTFRRISE